MTGTAQDDDLHVVIVHERFTEMGGSERVVGQFRTIWPTAVVFGAIVDQDAFPSELIDGVRTSSLQTLYGGGQRYEHLLPLMPAAMSNLDLGRPDVVITSHHAFSNRVRPPLGVPVVAYVHTPARWIWEPEMLAHEDGSRISRLALAVFATSQRRFDRAAAARTLLVVANSNHVAERIKRYWGIDATVLNPPVDTDFFTPAHHVAREDFFLLAGRLVPYKRPEIAVEAAGLAGVRLVVAGGGRALGAVEALAGPGVELLGPVTDEVMRDLFRRCRALVFPGIEDFGLVPVEAQACGAPVVAYNAGGVLDSVIDGVTGVLYDGGAEELAETLASFDPGLFDEERIRRHAERFATDLFRDRFATLVGNALEGVPADERVPASGRGGVGLIRLGDRQLIPVALLALFPASTLRASRSIIVATEFDNPSLDRWSPVQDARILLRSGDTVTRRALNPASTRRPVAGHARVELQRASERALVVVANIVLAGFALRGRVDEALALAIAVPAALTIRRRPQLGLLMLVALAPFEGLLDIVPHPGFLAGWKEALVVVTLAATFLAPDSARGPTGRRLPPWTLAVAALFAVSVVSAVSVGGVAAVYGLKITFFYVLLAWAIWRCPPDARERDRLVTVLFVTGLLAALYGLAQQVVGPTRLNQLGYEYNTTIRFSGAYLRSFSTFVQPFGFGFYEMVVMLVCLAVSLDQRKRLRSRLFFLCLPVLFMGMLLTFVRGAWIGFAVGIAYLGFRRHRGLLLAIPLALVLLVALPTNGASRAALSGTSGQERAVGWSQRSRQMLSHPIGSGIGSTGASAEKAQLLRGVKTPDYYTPDNQYFLELYELGILGLWCLVRLFASVISSLRGAEERLTGADSSFARGTTAMVVAAAAASLTASYLQIFPMDVLWWAFISVVAATDAGTRRREPAHSVGARWSAEPDQSVEPERPHAYAYQ